jgi:hypothetical protein
MAKRNRLHVVPSGNGWAVKPEGSSKPLSGHETQAAAINAARTTARRQQGEVITHRPNGQIRDSDSYGNDPNPPTDKKH